MWETGWYQYEWSYRLLLSQKVTPRKKSRFKSWFALKRHQLLLKTWNFKSIFLKLAKNKPKLMNAREKFHVSVNILLYFSKIKSWLIIFHIAWKKFSSSKFPIYIYREHVIHEWGYVLKGGVFLVNLLKIFRRLRRADA